MDKSSSGEKANEDVEGGARRRARGRAVGSAGGGPGRSDRVRRGALPDRRAGAARHAGVPRRPGRGQGAERRGRAARAAGRVHQHRRQVRPGHGGQRGGRADRPGRRPDPRALRLRLRRAGEPRGPDRRAGRAVALRLGPALQLLVARRQAVHALDVEHHHGGDRGRVRLQGARLEDRLRRHRPVHRLYEVAVEVLHRALRGARRRDPARGHLYQRRQQLLGAARAAAGARQEAGRDLRLVLRPGHRRHHPRAARGGLRRAGDGRRRLRRPGDDRLARPDARQRHLLRDPHLDGGRGLARHAEVHRPLHGDVQRAARHRLRRHRLGRGDDAGAGGHGGGLDRRRGGGEGAGGRASSSS